jgi:hypothetical protein
MPAPHEEYERRLALRRTRAEGLRRRGRAISNARLAVFAAGVVAGGFVFIPPHRLDLAWLAPFAVGFVVLVVLHDRVIQGRNRCERSVAFYERGLARLFDRWAGGGDGGERYLDPHHPYAADLDVFGHGSLFELLCTARTRAGEDALARWLCDAAPPQVVVERQAAIRELAPRLDLREDLSLLGAEVRARFDPDQLEQWGAEPLGPPVPLARAAAPILAGLGVASVGLWILTPAGPFPLLASIALESLFAWRYRARVRQTIARVDAPMRDLALFGALLERLERERFTAPRLQALRAALSTQGVAPSRRIAQLQRLVDLLAARQNQLFAPLAALLLWGTQLAFAIEAWRSVCGPKLSGWIRAAGEIEALCALAGHAYEHPDDPFPELEDGEPHFDGEGLGHPLVPIARCVRNDVALGGAQQLFIVSGSNMSGKSTLLRTVGINAVLAQAGAPVRARRLHLSPMSVGVSIRILDSLQEGSSRFYAEITRLRQIVDLAGDGRPLLFLLDEILHGTNSHDRRIGAEAVVRGLVDRGALGLVTTHDLALTRITESLGERARNVHFEDHLEDGEMRFDYALREGVVAKSNAIALMRAVGLEV